MQYYKKPRDCDTKDLLKSIDRFCALIDEVNEFRIIGGEPFMNREFHLLTDKIINEPKVKKIVFYTNGTIIPNSTQLKSLMNKKVLIIITDYGALSKNIEGLTQTLRQKHIAFYAQKAHGWTDCSGITKHNRSSAQNTEIFRNCCAKNTVTLSEGKLYRCPFSANADRLLAVPRQENDFVDILYWKKGSEGIDEKRREIKDLLLNKHFLKVCDYCTGRSFMASEIAPAVQTRAPLEYEEHKVN
jgi:hypothetical protein